MRIYKKYQPGRPATIFHGDCIDLFKKIEADSIDLTITSPPYCMGKKYENSKDAKDFIIHHESILPEIIRITKPGGSICWQTGYHVKNNIVLPLDYIVYEIMSRYKDIFLRNRLIWTFGHGAHCNNRFSGRHEVVLWYTKGKDYYFDLDSVRVPQKYPGKKHYKGPKKGQYSGNPLGKNPSDVWDIPHIKANHMEKTSHPCQFPIALAQQLVKSLSPKGGLVLDPFLGSGTTAAAAILEGRTFVGAEKNDEYYEIAVKRLKDASKGHLKHRPLCKPIYEPAGNESVVQKPGHFS